MARDDKRERLLAAAAAVFAERDFHRVQVSDVAERAGVGKGTVYLYFPTKDDLHRAALEASLEGYQNPVPADVLDFQMRIAIREATDLGFVPPAFRAMAQAR